MAECPRPAVSREELETNRPFICNSLSHGGDNLSAFGSVCSSGCASDKLKGKGSGVDGTSLTNYSCKLVQLSGRGHRSSRYLRDGEGLEG